MLIDSIRNAEERLVQRDQGIGRRCRIVMDLAGPKIRTRSTGLEMRPLKISVPKDIYGKTVRMVEGFLDGKAQFTEKISLTGVPPSFVISIKEGSSELPNLDIGERLSFYDSRGRYRTLTVLERISPTRVKIGLDKTAFLQEDIALYKQKYGKDSNIDTRNRKKVRTQSGMSDTTKGLVGPSLNLAEFEIHGSDINEENYNADNSLLKIGHLSPQATDVLVKSGDRILLRKKETDLDSHSMPFTRYEKNIAREITCNLPEILGSIQVGHRVYIDDGKISSVVKSIADEHLELEILSPSRYLLPRLSLRRD